MRKSSKYSYTELERWDGSVSAAQATLPEDPGSVPSTYIEGPVTAATGGAMSACRLWQSTTHKKLHNYTQTQKHTFKYPASVPDSQVAVCNHL